ncbi:Ig-like domain-containing protein, partial [[Roseibacterium] beibuensis]
MRKKICVQRCLKHIALALATLWCITAFAEEARAQATDTTPPRIQSITRFDPVDQYTSETELEWEVTFTEDVTSVSLGGDFQIDGNVRVGSLAVLGAVQVTPSVYRFRLRFSFVVSDGTGTIRLEPRTDAVIMDMAGNAMTDFSVIGAYEGYNPDSVAPTLSITSSASFPTNSSVIPLTFTFSEIVTDFDASDLTLTQGTGSFSNFRGSGSTYTADLTLSSAGAFEVAVADAAAVDRAGNPGTGATLSGTRDVTAPTAVLSAIPSEVNGPFDVTVTFDEDMTGFALGDFTVVNGTASNLQAVSLRVYSATITPDGDGIVTVSVGTDAATDVAGNGNTASNSESTTADVARPTVTLGVPSGSVSAPFSLTMTFSEEVTGIALGDIVVSNGAATNLQPTSPTVYTATITPASDGTVTVNFPENSVRDAFGNDNEAADQVSVTYDATAPTAILVSLASDSATPNIAGTGDTITLSLTVDEDVVEPTVTIQGETASVSGSGSNWTATLTVGSSTTKGDVSFTVSGIEDLTGNTATDITSTTDGSFVRIGDPPSFSAVFSPDAIIQGETSTLTFTVDNSANAIAATALDFTNNLPTGLEVANPTNASTTCTGGTLTAISGAGTLSYTGGTVSAGATCTVSADVLSTAGGNFVNASGDLTSSLGNSGSASDTLEVTADTV